ncbi:MAG TPA: phosphate ABC transporter permease PtsA, partial [bacterium]
MELNSLKKRRRFNSAIQVVSSLSALLGLAALLWILLVVLQRGVGALNWDFFTKLPTPPGIIGGGLANAIVGTLLITLLAAIWGTPLGILAGVYLSEYGKGTKIAAIIRSMTNILIGIPSIIVGVFVYALIVLPSRTFSAYAGAASL